MRGEIGGVFVMTEYSTLEVCNLFFFFFSPVWIYWTLAKFKILKKSHITIPTNMQIQDFSEISLFPPGPIDPRLEKNEELLPTPHPEAAKPQNTAE